MSDFKLYPVPESLLDNIEPLFTTAHSEMVMQPKATVKQAMASVKNGYANRTLGVYVDSVTNPKHCLVLAHVPGVLIEGVMVVVMLIYSTPEERGRKDILDAMHLTIDSYARLHGAETIIGSSWKFRGSRGIDAMWKSRGYEEQEVTYVKLLQ